MSCRINCKPLSVNRCWQGRRFKTIEYKRYEQLLLSTLPKYQLPKKPFSVSLIFGLSSINNDIDNSVKPFLDILQKKYGFNDRDVFELYVKKEVVNKGCEFIEFEINNICI